MTDYLKELAKTLAAVDPSPLLAFIHSCTGTIWVCGNGGSAATAQHWACDLSKGAGCRVQALGCNTALLTAWANDVAYSGALHLELAALTRPGDAVICLSCSGTSQNIANVLLEAKARGLSCALVTGLVKEYKVMPDLVVTVPSDNYGIIEDCHLAIGHWLTEALR